MCATDSGVLIVCLRESGTPENRRMKTFQTLYENSVNQWIYLHTARLLTSFCCCCWFLFRRVSWFSFKVFAFTCFSLWEIGFWNAAGWRRLLSFSVVKIMCFFLLKYCHDFYFFLYRFYVKNLLSLQVKTEKIAAKSPNHILSDNTDSSDNELSKSNKQPALTLPSPPAYSDQRNVKISHSIVKFNTLFFMCYIIWNMFDGKNLGKTIPIDSFLTKRRLVGLSLFCDGVKLLKILSAFLSWADA